MTAVRTFAVESLGVSVSGRLSGATPSVATSNEIAAEVWTSTAGIRNNFKILSSSSVSVPNSSNVPGGSFIAAVSFM